MRRLAILLTTVMVLSVQSVVAQEPAKDDANSELALRQGRIADKYARLEQLMLKMGEVDAGTNPQRAALLKRAVQQSKENLTRTQLESIVKLLDSQQLKRAVDGQTEATSEMKALLELLLSENRADRNKSEQEKIKEYIKEVERLIRLQKDVQGRTEGGDKTEKVAQDQAKIADRTGDLSKKLQEDEDAAKPGDPMSSGEPMPGEPKPGDNPEEKPEKKPGDKPEDKPESKPGEKPEDMKPGHTPAEGDPKPGDKSMPGDKPMPSEMPPGEQQPMPGAKPMPGQPMPGEPMPGEPMPGSESKPPEDAPQEQQEQNPAKKRLQAAEQKMRDAQKKLDEAKRKDAQEEQEKARQELEKAKAELEEILRQLREEEIERTLAQLESRFRKMLEMQLKVYEATQRLESVPPADRGREIEIEAGRLAVDERKIALEADKAYNLLLEEGSSIAFPESVEQVRIDMEQVAERLSQTKLDPVTVGVEEEIIAALNELIAALQQEQKKREEDKKKEEQEQQQPMSGEQEDDPLVDKIAELKMIKSMQLRVNDRTKRFAKMLAEADDVVGQATDVDLADAIVKLGQRQEKLHRITRDIVLGRNK